MTKLAALWRKDPGFVVSGGAHLLALVLLLVNFSHAPTLEDAHEATPIEMVTTSELNQITNGELTAKPLPQPQRRVDKLAALEEFKPDPPTPEAKKDTPPPPAPGKANDDPGTDEKPPEKAAAAPPPPPPRPAEPTPVIPMPVAPPPVPTPPERPVEKAEAPQAADAPTPPPRPEPVQPPPPLEAEAVEPTPPPRPKVETKPEPPKKVAKLLPVKPTPRPRPVEAKAVPLPPREPAKEPPKETLKEPPVKPQPTALDRVAQLLDTLKLDALKSDKPPVKSRSGNEAKAAPRDDFSLAKISALLDHEAPQHKASTGRALAQTASLGAPDAHAAKMTPQLQAQIDGWFVDHYIGCWHYFGTGSDGGYIPKVRVIVTADGALMDRPQLINPPSNPNLRSLADSAMRAVKECDPLPIPAWIKPHYEMWQNHVIDFDPKEKA